MYGEYDKDERRLYYDLAWIWPILSPPEDYVRSSELFSRLIREHSKKPPRTLLHLGCGGGHNDSTFKKHFELTGIDISDGMLKLAGNLNPEVEYLRGDMRTVRLGREFDAVAILDSIGYMLTVEELHEAFLTAWEHLKPGGVFLTHVEETSENFKQNATSFLVRKHDDVELVTVENYYDPDPSDTTYELTFVYLIRRGGKPSIQTDHHLCGLFPLGTWFETLKRLGFKVRQAEFEDSSEWDEGPILACVKPL